VRVLTAQQMREADRRAIASGIPSLTLMEHAGSQVVAAMLTAFPDLGSLAVAVVCGRGNNGGDGFVIARLLHDRGIAARTVVIGGSADLRGDAAVNLARLRDLGASVEDVPDEEAWSRLRESIVAADVIVDAIVGTGLSAPLTGLAAAVVRDINAARRRVVAVDLPSGVIADRSDLPGEAVDAALTVTMGAPKLALTQPPAEARAGALVVADIGISAEILGRIGGAWVELVTRESARRLLPGRRQDSHKGDYGRILVVAGSPGKTGAASLAAMGALRSGAGLVTVATPAACADVVASLGREYMTLALESAAGLVTTAALPSVIGFEADVVAAGPGLGRSDAVTAFIGGLVGQCRKPLVLDADALHGIARNLDVFQRRRGISTVLTPHPGEMAALTGRSIASVQANRIDVAREFATEHGVAVVLKGSRTVIAMPNGNVSINSTGNPGMATAGTGDVLTGALAAWMAQVPNLEAACRLAVYLHGAAGDLAAQDEGETGLIAGDLVARLGRAARGLAGPVPGTMQP
jgi:NAD(P)H-hydrate epimerase